MHLYPPTTDMVATGPNRPGRLGPVKRRPFDPWLDEDGESEGRSPLRARVVIVTLMLVLGLLVVAFVTLANAVGDLIDFLTPDRGAD